MATVTISLPRPMSQWVEAAVRDGGYSDVGEYLRALIDRDREEQPLTVTELENLLVEAETSGLSDRTVDEIAAEGRLGAGLR